MYFLIDKDPGPFSRRSLRGLCLAVVTSGVLPKTNMFAIKCIMTA